MPPPPPGETPGLLEARAARARATQGLIGAIIRGPEAREVADRVHEHGRLNHWSELWDVTIRRPGGP